MVPASWNVAVVVSHVGSRGHVPCPGYDGATG